MFSGGHATGLVYSLLHLWGYDVSIEDLKNFRQLNSKTPGHPEFGHTPGVEITTGPLGQGIANAVGFAMASKFVANQVNKESDLIDHNVYCLCGDGDLQEGISYEACSQAGLQKLDNLVVIYDSNEITIEGSTELSFTEDVRKRFYSQDWEVFEVDGHNFEDIDKALTKAKAATKPCLIIANTTIAKGACELEGSHHSHGAPLGEEEIANAKKKAGFDATESFFVDADVEARFRTAIELGDLAEREWNKKLNDAPEAKAALEALQNPDFSKIIFPNFETGSSVATRSSNGKIINAIADAIPSFLGGSADLGPSNKSELAGKGDFPVGRNIHFGIREHSMAAIANAMATYGCLLPFTATFFVFSDYLKPAARIAALMKAQHFFIWTHDSIGVGEDGPTHEPIEHLAQFRALPDFYVFRPADANENVEAWKTALALQAPSAFVLSRQNLPVLDASTKVGEASKGAYKLCGSDDASVTLIATGSEVSLAVESAKLLAEEGIKCDVVSVPCYDLFVEQDKAYIDSIIKPGNKTFAIEAARGLEWYRFADEVISMNSFGASGNANDLFKHFGFTKENVASVVKAAL